MPDPAATSSRLVRPLELLAFGPDLRDPVAAQACVCGCHPRPAELASHGGGAECPCQFTPDERRERTSAALAGLSELRDGLASSRQTLRDAATREATRLGVELDDLEGLAPLVLRGRVDGHGFYLRLRWESWQVGVGIGPDPEADPWQAPRDEVQIIAEGSESDLCDADGHWDGAAMVRTAAVAVRRWLLLACPHEASPGANFCPRCGQALSVRFGALPA